MQDRPRQLRDEWIALGCRAGDPKAFEAMVREFEGPLLYYATKLIRDESAALDVIQPRTHEDSFRKLGKTAKKVRKSLGTLRELDVMLRQLPASATAAIEELREVDAGLAEG